MPDGPFLTSEEVRGYLQVRLRTLYRLIKTNQIPAIRLGGQWRFRRRDIDDYLRKKGKAATPPAGAATHRPRVLVVDDDLSVLTVVSRTLALFEYDVATAESGMLAIEHLQRSDYDLVIADLKMPGMDGLSFIRQTRQQSQVPIIIMTAFSTEASAIEAINLSVCGYLTKPFRIPRLVSMAARALGDPEPPPEVIASFEGVENLTVN
jgi:excisionase family DNA binding protein